MRRLGELLLERGAIAMEELQTCLEECRRTGGRLGTQLLKFGFVEERALLEALSDQLSVPFVPRALLQRASPLVRGTLPPEVAHRLKVVPFEASHGRLHVAMINPRDPAALEEISGYSDLMVEPYVCTEAGIRAALGEQPPADEDRQPRPTRPAESERDGWDRLWSDRPVAPEALLRLRPDDGSSDVWVLTSSYPGLAPVVSLEGEAVEPELDADTFVDRLKEVSHRDEVASLLVRFACRLLPRVCLFAVHKDRVVGWTARGQSVVVDDIQSVQIPHDEPSIFTELRQASGPYMGTIPEGKANAALVNALGDPPPRQVAVVPVWVKDRPVAFLLGDDPGEDAVTVPLQELVDAANKAGVALEILILKKKIEA